MKKPKKILISNRIDQVLIGWVFDLLQLIVTSHYLDSLNFMHEIKSQYSGIVRSILVKEGAPVDFVIKLFVIEKTGE